MPPATSPKTSAECYQYLASRGFLLHRTGKNYVITNFRGGRCFTGNLAQLKQHLQDFYYGEPAIN